MKALIVEDDRILSNNICESLKHKFDMTQAFDGEEGLERLARESFDVIILDVMMPRLNGYEAAAAIRARDRADARRVPILALTADAFPEDALLARRYGMNEHMSKPVAAEQLYQAVRRWLL